METLQRTANRGSISTGYDIDNSIGLEEANNENLRTTNQAAGNQKTWTFSVWAKRTQINYSWATIFGAGRNYIAFDLDDRLQYRNYDGTNYYLESTARFRDTSAWYHIVAIQDTTQATASNRVRLYVNGEQITDFSTEDYPTQNLEGDLGGVGSSLNWLQFGRFYSGGRHYSGYLAEAHYLNGTVAEATEFGEYDEDSGIWIPKEYTGGGYGTQGFYYKFDNAGSLGEDSSGEGHDANTYDNVTSANQATDTPTNNFCTLNVLNNKYLTITEGATKSVESTDSVWYGCTTTIGVNNGKWYSEGKAIAIGTGIFFGVTPFNGTADASIGMGSSVFPGNVADTIGYWNGGGGQVYRDNSVAATIGAFVANDIIGIALDMDNGYVYFAKNGTWLNSGDPTSGATGTGGFSLLNPTETHGFAYGVKNSTAGINLGGYTVNTISSAASDANGYGTFEYAPPSGYYALCTKNLAEFG